MRRIFALFLLAVLAGVPPLPAAQSSNFTWWNNPILVKELNLTADQTEKIRTIVRSYRDRLFDARNRVQKAEAQLDDMMNDQRVDPVAAKPVIDRLVDGRANSLRLITEMSVQLRTVITADQWQQLARRWRELQKDKKLADTQVAQ